MATLLLAIVIGIVVLATSTNSARGTGEHLVGGPGDALRFAATFTTGIAPWKAIGGSAQCANYGTQSVNGRLRGNLYFRRVDGLPAAQFYDGLNPDPSTWLDQNCELTGALSGSRALVLPSDEYIGLAFYVPRHHDIPNDTGRTNIGEFHFQNVGNQPPVALMLHRNYVGVNLTLGSYSAATGFAYARYGQQRLPATYAIPPRRLVPGTWNDIVFHAHWAADPSGSLQFYYKAKGATRWSRGSSISGIPTVSWFAGSPPLRTYIDAVGNYGRAFTRPFSIYEADIVDGTSLGAVEAAMP